MRAGILIETPDGFVTGHPTGFPEATRDIIKGHVDHFESITDCVLRECKEETGIELNLLKLLYVGRFKYMSEDLELYYTYMDKLDITTLHCDSLIDKGNNTGKPEFDGFDYQTLDYPGFYKSLKEVFNGICLYTQKTIGRL